MQATDAAPIEIDEIRDCALRFERAIRRRNLREQVAGALVIAVFGLYFWALDGPWTRTGSLLVIAGSLYVAVQMRKRGSLGAGPADAPLIDSFCADLERQRDALLSVWRWYLLPLVPGLVVFSVGLEVDNPPGAWASLAIYLAIGIAMFVGIHALNQRAASQLQSEIDKLRELQCDG